MSAAASLKVEVRNLTKRFKLYPGPAARLAEWMTLGAWKRHTDFTAVSNISFTVRAGEFFGILGPNGAGKSTLLKVLTGVLMASEGFHRIDGRVTSLLELGTGFNPELTGKENILNSSRLLGLRENFIRSQLDAIIDFSDLAEHIDVPVKYYSSGMVVRLAFAMFAHVEPDVFIVDEALSVGDVAFAQKCFARLDRMRLAGCTLLFASHDLAAIRKYCDQALFLNHGQCAFLGKAIEATDLYLEAMSPGGRARDLAPQTASSVDEAPSEMLAEVRGILPESLTEIFNEASIRRAHNVRTARIGTGTVRIVAIHIAKQSYAIGESMQVHVLSRATEDVAHATVSIQLVNRMGIAVWGTNHHRRSGQTTPMKKGAWVHAVFDIKLDLGQDQYTLDVSYGDASGEGHVFDRITAVATITVLPDRNLEFLGLVRLPCHTTVTTHEPEGAPV